MSATQPFTVMPMLTNTWNSSMFCRSWINSIIATSCSQPSFHEFWPSLKERLSSCRDACLSKIFSLISRTHFYPCTAVASRDCNGELCVLGWNPSVRREFLRIQRNKGTKQESVGLGVPADQGKLRSSPENWPRAGDGVASKIRVTGGGGVFESGQGIQGRFFPFVLRGHLFIVVSFLILLLRW